MKMILRLNISLFLFIFCQLAFAQGNAIRSDSTKADSNRSITELYYIEKNASFKGGDIIKYNKWVQKNIEYPVDAYEISGKVVVQFSVGTDGKICDIRILRSVHPLLDNEVIKILKNSPPWKPAISQGKPVKQNFTMPIVFSIQ